MPERNGTLTHTPFLVLMPEDVNRQKSWTTTLKNAEAICRADDEGRNDFDPEDISLVYDHISWALRLGNQKKLNDSANDNFCEGMSIVFGRLREIEPAVLEIMRRPICTGVTQRKISKRGWSLS